MTRELCIMACCFCRDPQFHAWLGRLETERTGETIVFGEESAKAFILASCNVSSRSDLDTNPKAAERFHTLVRKPFLEWKGEAS